MYRPISIAYGQSWTTMAFNKTVLWIRAWFHFNRALIHQISRLYCVVVFRNPVSIIFCSSFYFETCILACSPQASSYTFASTMILLEAKKKKNVKLCSERTKASNVLLVDCIGIKCFFNTSIDRCNAHIFFRVVCKLEFV